MALSTFVSGWSFLLSIELFTTMQLKFAGMSDAPTIVQAIIYPVISAQAKLLIVIVAIVAGLSFSRLAHNNGWSLVIGAQYTEWTIIKHKYLAILFITLIFIVPTTLATVSLMMMASLPVLPIIIALMGLLLLVMWMLALAMYLSCLVSNTGFAILLCIVVLMFLWLLSQSSIDSVWGKNWLQVLSPYYHFQQFTSAYISLAAMIYFIAGTIICLWATKIRLIHKRYSLS